MSKHERHVLCGIILHWDHIGFHPELPETLIPESLIGQPHGNDPTRLGCLEPTPKLLQTRIIKCLRELVHRELLILVDHHLLMLSLNLLSLNLLLGGLLVNLMRSLILGCLMRPQLIVLRLAIWR